MSPRRRRRAASVSTLDSVISSRRFFVISVFEAHSRLQRTRRSTLKMAVSPRPCWSEVCAGARGPSGVVFEETLIFSGYDPAEGSSPPSGHKRSRCPCVPLLAGWQRRCFFFFFFLIQNGKLSKHGKNISRLPFWPEQMMQLAGLVMQTFLTTNPLLQPFMLF